MYGENLTATEKDEIHSVLGQPCLHCGYMGPEDVKLKDGRTVHVNDEQFASVKPEDITDVVCYWCDKSLGRGVSGKYNYKPDGR
jgi:hypothetical protein